MRIEPEEKALEIINAMYMHTDPLYPKTYAKQCALIVAETALKEWDYYTYRDLANIEYWEKVKQAIQNA